MKRFKTLATWRLIVWAALYLSVFFYFSCGGDEEVGVAPTVQEAATFTVDATSREAWTYFSFAKGGVVEVADPGNSMNWDLGFQRTKVKLNGGISGAGKGRAVMLTDIAFSEVNEAPGGRVRHRFGREPRNRRTKRERMVHLHRSPKSLDSPSGESCLCGSSGGWNVCQTPLCRLLQGQREQNRRRFHHV